MNNTNTTQMSSFALQDKRQQCLMGLDRGQPVQIQLSLYPKLATP